MKKKALKVVIYNRYNITQGQNIFTAVVSWDSESGQKIFAAIVSCFL
jgi:hypothetical protein